MCRLRDPPAATTSLALTAPAGAPSRIAASALTRWIGVPGSSAVVTGRASTWIGGLRADGGVRRPVVVVTGGGCAAGTDRDRDDGSKRFGVARLAACTVVPTAGNALWMANVQSHATRPTAIPPIVRWRRRIMTPSLVSQMDRQRERTGAAECGLPTLPRFLLQCSAFGHSGLWVGMREGTWSGG